MSLITEYFPSEKEAAAAAEYENFKAAGGGAGPPAASRPLPAMVDAVDFISTPIAEPPQIIHGILHQGSKLALGGGSKSFKTWQLLDMSVSVCSGTDWLKFPTSQANVLYINFEIQDYAWQKRVQTVCKAKGVELERGRLTLLNLRGYAADYRTLIPQIIDRARDREFGLMILDPSYKLYGSADENSASDIAGLCNAIEAMTVETKAAAAFGAHFSKGNQSQKESIDRISGSGVFARDPDSLLTLTRHEEDNAFTLDAILRNFPPVEPFVVRWQYPLMRPDDDLDPSRLKQSNPGRKREHDPLKLLMLIRHTTKTNPISVSAWAAVGNVSRPTLIGYLSEMRVKKWIGTVGDGNSARQFITDCGLNALPVEN